MGILRSIADTTDGVVKRHLGDYNERTGGVEDYTLHKTSPHLGLARKKGEQVPPSGAATTSSEIATFCLKATIDKFCCLIYNSAQDKFLTSYTKVVSDPGIGPGMDGARIATRRVDGTWCSYVNRVCN